MALSHRHSHILYHLALSPVYWIQQPYIPLLNTLQLHLHDAETAGLLTMLTWDRRKILFLLWTGVGGQASNSESWKLKWRAKQTHPLKYHQEKNSVECLGHVLKSIFSLFLKYACYRCCGQRNVNKIFKTISAATTLEVSSSVFNLGPDLKDFVLTERRLFMLQGKDLSGDRPLWVPRLPCTWGVRDSASCSFLPLHKRSPSQRGTPTDPSLCSSSPHSALSLALDAVL